MFQEFSNFDYISRILAGTVITTVAISSHPAIVAAKSPAEVAHTAEITTVGIDNSLGDPGGTGVIIAKKENNYTVLTVNHVVRSTDAHYAIRTYQQKVYPVTKVERLQTTNDAPDLALVTFTTSDEYVAAPLGNSDRAAIGVDIYVCGYPLPSLGNSSERIFQFTKGIVASRLQSRPRGYTLRYDAITRKGMSGGPVFDILGRVVGIHGEADIDDSVAGDSGQTVAIKTGINSGIPINVFLTMKSKTEANIGVVDNTPTGEDPMARISNPQTAGDFAFRGIVRQQEGNGRAALEDFDRAIALDPNDILTYYKRGIARFNQGNHQGANEDFTKVISLVPDYIPAYFNRGLTRQIIKDYEGMRSDFDRVISLEPNLVEAYNNRAAARSALGDRAGALEDLTKVIALRPNVAVAYNNRARLRNREGDKQGAIADFNEVIRLEPENGVGYYNRGLIRHEIGDRQGAIADLQKAIELFQKKGETSNYQKAQEHLIRIMAAPDPASNIQPGASGNSQTPTSNPESTPQTDGSGNSKRFALPNYFLEKLNVFRRVLLFIWH